MRLTKWSDGRIHQQNDEQDFDLWEIDVIKKLAAYEDAEEQGRLIVLPCKVGTLTFTADDIFEIIADPINRYSVDVAGEVYFETENYYERPISEIGKTVFLSREEAEAALKGEKDDV